MNAETKQQQGESVQPLLLEVPPDVSLAPPAAPRQGIHDGSRADPDGLKARSILRMRAMGVPALDVARELQVSATYVVSICSQNEETMDILRAQRLCKALVTEQMIQERILEVVSSAKASELPGLALATKATIDSAGGSAPQRLVISLEGQESDEMGLARMGFGAGNISAMGAGQVVDVETVPGAAASPDQSALDDSQLFVSCADALDLQGSAVPSPHLPPAAAVDSLPAGQGGEGVAPCAATV